MTLPGTSGHSPPAVLRLDWRELLFGEADVLCHRMQVSLSIKLGTSGRAENRYGFEWQELYYLDCKDKGKAWLEVPFDLDDAAIRPLRRAPKGAGIVNLTLKGVFVSGNHHSGHMGIYPYKFVVHKITDVAVVSKGMKPLAEEEKAEKQWAFGGTNPK